MNESASVVASHGVGIVSLDHVQVAAPPGCEAQARAFYCDVLGLREIPKPPELAVRGGIWCEGPGFQLHVGVESPFVAARKAHPAFAVRSVDDTAAALDAAGVEFTRDSAVPGLVRGYVHDPFGNRIELTQAL